MKKCNMGKAVVEANRGNSHKFHRKYPNTVLVLVYLPLHLAGCVLVGGGGFAGGGGGENNVFTWKCYFSLCLREKKDLWEER